MPFCASVATLSCNTTGDLLVLLFDGIYLIVPVQGGSQVVKLHFCGQVGTVAVNFRNRADPTRAVQRAILHPHTQSHVQRFR